MIKVYNKTHWKPARSEPALITKGKHKGKYRVEIFTGTPDHPEGLSTIIVKPDDINEDDTPQAVIRMRDAAAKAVKFGNGLKQADLFKKAEQRGLF